MDVDANQTVYSFARYMLLYIPFIIKVHLYRTSLSLIFYILRYSQEKTAEEFPLSIISRYITTLFVPFLFEIGDKDLKPWLFQSPCYAVVQAKLPT